MANKDGLSRLRSGTIINAISKKQEQILMRALARVQANIEKKFSIQLHWRQEWMLTEIVADLRVKFPTVDFSTPLASSCMKPDGGILSVVDNQGKRHPILITEKKNQGTNDRLAAAGKKKQAKGNAIERLGKNVIGLKTAMVGTGIFPFICFGDGCDFADASSILDRVATIAMFGHLRKIYMVPLGANEEFLRGSFYFREEHWTEDEMFQLMVEVATRAVHHYIARFGEAAFKRKK